MPVTNLLRRLSRIPRQFAHSYVLQPRPGWFGLRNRFARARITRPEGPVVSLTSYGKRVNTVHLTIESISRGDVLPSRIILWLDDEVLFRNLPSTLRRLARRGLEVKLCRNYGPHTKYYPYVESEEVLRTPLVTADDDILYPRDWLKGLVEVFSKYPQYINCYRARVVEVNELGLADYATWKLCNSTEPMLCHLATGVSGVIYPPPFLGVLKQAGRAFEVCCPKADDLWLHVQALRAGYKVRQIHPQPFHFPIIPGTQDGALFNENCFQNDGNNRQVKTTYSGADIEILRVDHSAVQSELAGNG